MNLSSNQAVSLLRIPVLFAAVCLLCATPLVAGENYALLVAVGDYAVKDLRPLKYTRADVLEFHQALIASGFPAKNTVLLHDDIAKLAEHCKSLGPQYKPKDYLPLATNIRRETELLLGRLRDDDSVVVAFSGHGVQFAGKKKSYFCPADADLERKESLIGFDELYAALKDSEATRKLLLVDACQNDPLSEIGKNRATVKLDSVTRPQSEPVPEGIIALFSCKAGQKSYEWPDLGHGVFFYHVLDGWKGNGDINSDGKLSYQELALYAEKKTSEFAAVNLKVLQTPQLRTDFSGEWILKELKRGPKSLVNSLGTTLLRIEPGEYLRGASIVEIDSLLREDPVRKREWFENEMPQHRVRISEAFYLGKTEITQAEFQAVMNVNPSWFSKAGGGRDKITGVDSGRLPAENITWYAAVEFCNRLSTQEKLAPYYRLENVDRNNGLITKAEVIILGGSGYRLPTEAEWEYACRAGSTTHYHFGNSSNGRESTVKGDLPSGTTLKGIAPQRTTPVGSYPANAWGLHDMHGNVQEWCQDGYDATAYRNLGRPTVDPLVKGQGEGRVLRGGSWFYGPAYARSAYRYEGKADIGTLNVGFRVTRTP